LAVMLAALSGEFAEPPRMTEAIAAGSPEATLRQSLCSVARMALVICQFWCVEHQCASGTDFTFSWRMFRFDS
jgi:hypothetical protein